MTTQQKARMNTKAGLCSLVLLLSALLLSACSVLGKPAREPLDLTILHTGKVYGEILPCG
jgi:hypothetical protein